MPIRLTLVAAQDLTLPLYNTPTLIVSECTPMMFSALLAFTMHCYRILAGSCILSLTAIVRSCGSTDFPIDRACSRDQNMRISYSFEHSRSEPRRYLALGNLTLKRPSSCFWTKNKKQKTEIIKNQNNDFLKCKRSC